ncbi:hypothetical protein GQ43DRAFT_281528 [Delitschia confertaspora ATCC 74209]|uniref:Ankyrin repeat protein n=1 Tax=Delitschia confertaspora ATCC 74209 TaxID=1513339 RepID=A0A9P4MKK2_9PLEO|nr:hypothetical protein GQ43DRAFT_281528 [Delitschia confertaspora ATCC 74209]
MTSNGDSFHKASLIPNSQHLDDFRRHHGPVLPPQRIPSPQPPAKSSPIPSDTDALPSKDTLTSYDPLENGIHVHDDAQNESEAETVVLDDAPKGQGAADKEVIKTERNDNDAVNSLPTTDNRPKIPPSGVNGQRKASWDESARVNGAKNGTDRDVKSVPNSPSSRTTSRQVRDTSLAESATSPPPPTTATTTSPSHPTAVTTTAATSRGRSSSIVESRKRKLREDSKAIEPPRQKPRTDSLGRDTRNQPTSPATPGLARAHKRSQSTQSAVAQARRRREVPSLSLQNRSDSSSESSYSPRPGQTPGFPPHTRVRRSSNRAQTSPARTMPKKTVDRFGATRIARESEKGDLAAVQVAYAAAPHEIDQVDFAGISPLQKASLHGFVDVVEFLIDKGCRTDCASDERDTPLIDAVENGHLEVVKVLLDKGKVNPHHQNLKGQRAIDVLNSDCDNMEEIEKQLREAMLREANTSTTEESSVPEPNPAKPAPRLLYNEYNIETLVEKCADGDLSAVGELLHSNIKPNIACGVAAARAGHYDILSILLASGLKADPDPSKHRDTPMTVAIGRGHLKIVNLLLEQDNFDPTRRDHKGRTYYEIAEERHGPKWEQERDLLRKTYDDHQTRRSPRRSRKDAPSPLNIRNKTKSASARERSSSPPRGHARSSTAASAKPRGRLISGREKANQRDAKRRRRVVDDSSESDQDVRAPKKSRSRSTSLEEEYVPTRKSQPRSAKDAAGSYVIPVAPADDSDIENHHRLAKKFVKQTINTKPTAEADSPDERKPSAKIKTDPRQTSRDRPLNDASSDEYMMKHNSTTNAPVKASTPDSVRERCFEADKQAAAARRKAEKEEARKREEEQAARKAAEEEEARQKAVAAEKAKLVAEEQERTRLAEEAEAKRLAEEEVAKQVARRQRLSKLPLALRLACERGKNRPLFFRRDDKGEQYGIKLQFLPLFYANLKDIEPDCPPDLAKERYILSFQAVGILGLPELDLAHCGAPYDSWLRKPVTRKHIEAVAKIYDIAALAQDEKFPLQSQLKFNWKDIQAQIRLTRQQVLDMEGVYWIQAIRLQEAVEQDAELQPLLEWIADDRKATRIFPDLSDPFYSFMDQLIGKRDGGKGGSGDTIMKDG